MTKKEKLVDQAQEAKLEDAVLAKAKAQAKAELMAELGISQEQVDAAAKPTKSEGVMHVNLGRHIVRINGNRYTGSFKVPAATGETIMEMMSKRRERLLREVIRHENGIEMLQEAGYSATTVNE
jgi:hypothetical protein